MLDLALQLIAQMRKEQSMTQRELADRLCISDKTVSKWETGKGLPEVALMLPLCETLHITVNELLSGERLTAAEYQQKAEENMMDLVKEKEENKQAKQNKKEEKKQAKQKQNNLFHIKSSLFFYFASLSSRAASSS